MKKYFKSSIQLSLLAIISLYFFMVSCKGTEGPAGPAGSAGQTGPAGATGAAGAAGKDGSNGAAGAAGASGKDGNANVTQINYGAKSHTGADMFFAFGTTVAVADVDKSIYYVYVKQTVKTSAGTTVSFWFSVPGEIANGNEYSFYVTSATTNNGLFLRRVVNFVAGSDAFDDVRIVVVPSTTQVKGGRLASVNFKNYEEVRTAFNLPK
jgi:Collagen triple helix repeat (20 copies)